MVKKLKIVKTKHGYKVYGVHLCTNHLNGRRVMHLHKTIQPGCYDLTMVKQSEAQKQ